VERRELGTESNKEQKKKRASKSERSQPLLPRGARRGQNKKGSSRHSKRENKEKQRERERARKEEEEWVSSPFV
jgi:hypothetical protein